MELAGATPYSLPLSEMYAAGLVAIIINIINCSNRLVVAYHRLRGRLCTDCNLGLLHSKIVNQQSWRYEVRSKTK